MKLSEILVIKENIENRNGIAPMTMAEYYRRENLPSHQDHYESWLTRVPDREGLASNLYPRFNTDSIHIGQAMVAAAYVTVCHQLNFFEKPEEHRDVDGHALNLHWLEMKFCFHDRLEAIEKRTGSFKYLYIR